MKFLPVSLVLLPACVDKGYSWDSDPDGSTPTAGGASVGTVDDSMCTDVPQARRFHHAAFFNTLPGDTPLTLIGAGGGGRSAHRAWDRGLRR